MAFGFNPKLTEAERSDRMVRRQLRKLDRRQRLLDHALADRIRKENSALVATFSTNVHRLQQIFDVAKHYKRKVAVTGRSLLNTISVARELKYLSFPDSIMVELPAIAGMPDDSLVILTTGSQGEPMSALSRMANGEHRIKITDNDFVIISATPIPGNEKMVSRTIDLLFRQGAEVIYGRDLGVHVSGHASEEELKQYTMSMRGIQWRDLDEDISFESFEYEDAEPTALQRFFLTHKEINVAEFARSMDMNPTLLRNYINGFKKPSKEREREIINRIHELGKEMLAA